MKMLRITTVPFSLKTLLQGQMRYMSHKGIEVKMVSSDGVHVSSLVEQEGVPHVPISFTRKFNVFLDLKSAYAMYQLLRCERPEFIHVNTAKAGLISMVAGFFARVPVRIYTVGGFKFQSTRYSNISRSMMKLIERLIYFFATDVWPNNPRLVHEIRRMKLAPAKKVRLIGYGSSNGIDFTEFGRDSVRSEDLSFVKKQINYASDNRYLLFVGRLCGDKGIAELVYVFDRLQKELPDLVLILVGPIENFDDPLPTMILDQINHHPSIYHIEWSEKIPAFMEISDVFVFPSHREGLPNVLMQAGAMNLPIVCSRILGNVDLVSHEETGLLFEKGNRGDFYGMLKRALESDSEMKGFSDNLLKIVRTKYDRRVVHEAMFDSYMAIAKEKNLF